MNRTERNRLMKLLLLAAPLALAACTQRDASQVDSTATDEPITVAELPEVVVTASRLPPEEDERRYVARRDR